MSDKFSNISTSTLPINTYFVSTGFNFAIVVLTFILLFMIISVQKFRDQKEYMIISANLVHEFLYGAYALYLALNKLFIYWDDLFISIETRFYCFWSVLPFMFFMDGSGLIALTSAIDRLLAVSIPIKYLKFSRNYSIFFAFFMYLASIPGLIASFLILENGDYGSVEISGTCEFSGVSFPIINDIIRAIRALATVLSFLIYIPVSWKLAHVIAGEGSFKTFTKSQKKNLTKYTLTVSGMVFNELMFIVIPDFILMIWPTTQLRYFLFTLNMIKGLLNVFIIVILLKDFRIYYYNKFLKFINQHQFQLKDTSNSVQSKRTAKINFTAHPKPRTTTPNSKK